MYSSWIICSRCLQINVRFPEEDVHPHITWVIDSVKRYIVHENQQQVVPLSKAYCPWDILDSANATVCMCMRGTLPSLQLLCTTKAAEHRRYVARVSILLSRQPIALAGTQTVHAYIMRS